MSASAVIFAWKASPEETSRSPGPKETFTPSATSSSSPGAYPSPTSSTATVSPALLRTVTVRPGVTPTVPVPEASKVHSVFSVPV